MSLFGAATAQPAAGGSLFGNAGTAAKPSLFGSSTTNTGTTQPATGGGLFGNLNNNSSTTAAQPPASGSLFGNMGNNNAQQQQQQQPAQQGGGGLFGSSFAKPAATASTGGLFGASTAQQQPGQATGGSLFGGLGSTANQQQQQQQPQQGGSLFGGLGASTQQQPAQQTGGGLFGGQKTQQQQQQELGQSQLGQSQIWSPNRGAGVYRTIPMQMQLILSKWMPESRDSSFRTYLYNHVDAPHMYQPGPEDDEKKWEDALRARSDPQAVPVLVKGFFELGKRAQRQRDFLSMMQARLHEIDTALTNLLSRHELQISVKTEECKRKHQALSQRCLALAAKTQILRNRGYAMDSAEEDLKKKLNALERGVFDPALNGRGEEIWARMLAIRERSRRLMLEIERVGSAKGDGAEGEGGIDEGTMKTARKILDDYASQIHHLQNELGSIRKDFDDWSSPPGSSGACN